MGNGAIDYLSFVCGFTAATDSMKGVPGPDADQATSGDHDAYAEGYAAGSEPVEHTLIYRELSIQDGGRFVGRLDLSSADSDGGPWDEPLGQSRIEPAPAESAESPWQPPLDRPVQLSGTLELG